MSEIHIFSGLGTLFLPHLQLATRELEDLIESLPAGVEAHHHTHLGARKVWKRIIRKRDKGELTEPICLIGHSQGVRACSRVADILDDEGITVDYIAAIDPTLASFPPLGNNVRLVDQFWATKDFVAEGRRLSGYTAGVCTFVSGWGGRHILDKVNCGHIECAKHPEVRADILESIGAVISG